MARRAQFVAAASVALTAVLAGCGGSSVVPTAPTSTQPPAPGSTVVGERWNLTTTLRSITGPDDCNVVTTAEVGESFSWLMVIERSGESVRLFVSLVDDPLARDEYQGTVLEDVLTAAIKSRPGTTICGDSMHGVVAEARVSGRFSADGTFTGEELKSYQFRSGEASNAYFEWTAARQ
jgi:hypothetical protein